MKHGGVACWCALTRMLWDDVLQVHDIYTAQWSLLYNSLRTVSLQLSLSLPYCRHLVSLHPPAGNSAEVRGSGSHQFPLVRGGGRGCARDCGEEEFISVGGGEGEEDERR